MLPLNRFIVVELAKEEEQQQSTFYVPDDVVINKKPFEVVEIVDVSEESKFYHKSLTAGDKVLVEGHMIRKADVFGKEVCLIEDNFILGKC
jgi:co-chaperonin GroES (HSP10)